MILEITSVSAGIDWTSIILAAIGIVSGGALLKLYQAWIGKKKDEVASEQSYEESLRTRITELESKVDLLTDKITELVESNSGVIIRISSENAAFVERNQNLRTENDQLKERIQQLESE